MTVFNEIERAEIEAVKIAARTQLRMLFADLPSSYYKLLEGCILTGGAFASLFHGDTPNDWDVYLETEGKSEQFLNRVMNNDESIYDLILEINPNYRVRSTMVPGLYVTENAITFKNGLQIIINADRDTRLTGFDFVHCMPYFDMPTQQLFISRAQYDAIKNKQLTQNPNYIGQPLVQRLQKFRERGWK
jgi:hypothetical protein